MVNCYKTYETGHSTTDTGTLVVQAKYTGVTIWEHGQELIPNQKQAAIDHTAGGGVYYTLLHLAKAPRPNPNVQITLNKKQESIGAVCHCNERLRTRKQINITKQKWDRRLLLLTVCGGETCGLRISGSRRALTGPSHHHYLCKSLTIPCAPSLAQPPNHTTSHRTIPPV